VAEFTFEAMTTTGVRSKGNLVAGSEREALAMLDARGLFPVGIAPAKSVRRGGGKRVKSRNLTAFYAQLADLLHSGVPLLRCLDLLERLSSQAALSEVLREVRARVADGMGLSEAMAQHPRAFDELAVTMIRAGQEGGFLEDVLRHIADFTEQQEDLKSKVIGALAYPIFLAGAGFVILNVLVIFFVPQFEPMYKRLAEKGQLPSLTVGLLAFSHFMQSWGWAVAVAAFVAFYFFRRWVRTPSGRMIIDGFRLRLPVAGKIYLSFALSRFTRILGTLLHNGIPILNALRISKDSTGNKVLSEALERSAENITAGESLAAPLSACKHFPRDVVEMIAVGEESNNLDKVLIGISTSLEKRTTRQLELFVRLLEPVMLLVMAAVVLVVMAGLLLPVFKMGSVVQ
jgi:general secretion pathway protein F/type IV pilus assembly protein PilC